MVLEESLKESRTVRMTLDEKKTESGRLDLQRGGESTEKGCEDDDFLNLRLDVIDGIGRLGLRRDGSTPVRPSSSW
jgi:hypothetical protein